MGRLAPDLPPGALSRQTRAAAPVGRAIAPRPNQAAAGFVIFGFLRGSYKHHLPGRHYPRAFNLAGRAVAVVFYFQQFANPRQVYQCVADVTDRRRVIENHRQDLRRGDFNIWRQRGEVDYYFLLN